MTRDEEVALMVIAGLWMYAEYTRMGGIADKMKDAGARAYEMVHPDEKDHANDLPGQHFSKEQLIELARSVGFADPNLAAAIAMAESGGWSNALGDIEDGKPTSIGLWQIHLPAHHEYTREDMADPIKNARAALAISHSKRGFLHWSTYSHGTYKKFL